MRKVKIVLIDVGEYDQVYFEKNFPLIANIERIEVEIIKLTGSQIAVIAQHADATMVVVGYGHSNQSRAQLVEMIASACAAARIVGLIFHPDWLRATRDGCHHVLVTPHYLPFWVPKWLGFANGERLQRLVHGSMPQHIEDSLYDQLKAAGVRWS